MPRSTLSIRPSVSGPCGSGCRDTFAIRWIGMWPGESANAHPLERPALSSAPEGGAMGRVGAGGASAPAPVGGPAVELGAVGVRHGPVELVADQDAVAHDVPALGLH